MKLKSESASGSSSFTLLYCTLDRVATARRSDLDNLKRRPWDGVSSGLTLLYCTLDRIATRRSDKGSSHLDENLPSVKYPHQSQPKQNKDNRKSQGSYFCRSPRCEKR